jgi:Zn finger protein HypA/HybF involved in hydrogenase expression
VHCGTNKTKREFEGHPTCDDCRINILIEREPVLRCPRDGARMIKESYSQIIIDRCPQCNGVWLDAGEMGAIETAAIDEYGEDNGLLGVKGALWDI